MVENFNKKKYFYFVKFQLFEYYKFIIMAFWLINLESDIMLGFLPSSPKLSIVVGVIFWIINILNIFVEESYLIDNEK